MQSKTLLKHLNLGYTFIQNAILEDNPELINLNDINFDRTTICLNSFFKKFAKKPFANVKKLSLFNYNGDYLDDV